MALKIDDWRADYSRSKKYVASRQEKSVRHRLTDKRLLVLKFVMDGTGNPIDPWITFDELLWRLAYFGWPIDKKSAHFHVRPLVKMGLIEKRELVLKSGKQRRKLAGTAAGRATLEAYRASGRLELVMSKTYRIGH